MIQDHAMRDELIRQLRGDEGERSRVYQDHLGFWAIGVGRLMDKRQPNKLQFRQ